MFRALSIMRSTASAFNTDTTPTQPHWNSNTHRTKNNATNVVIQQNSRKLLMMDILMHETCWAHKKWNKIASDIKFVFYSSTILVEFTDFWSDLKVEIIFPPMNTVKPQTQKTICLLLATHRTSVLSTFTPGYTASLFETCRGTKQFKKYALIKSLSCVWLYIVYTYNCNFRIHRYEYFRTNTLPKFSSFHITVTFSEKIRLLYPWPYRLLRFFISPPNFAFSARFESVL